VNLKDIAVQLGRAAADIRFGELEALFLNLPVGLAIAEDAACQTIRINQAFADILGITLDQNASMSSPDAARLPYRFYQDGRELRADELPQQTAQRERRAVEKVEIEVRRADGTSRFIYGSAIPLIDDSGEVVGSIGAFVDTTERRLAEDRLRESEHHLRSFLELSPQLPWTADSNGNVVDFNQRWLDLTGLTREESLGGGWVRAIHPKDYSRTIEAYQHAISTGSNYEIEYRVRMADGSYRWMRGLAFPLRDAEGKVIRWYGSTEDIHARKLAEQAAFTHAEHLKRSNEALEQFAYAASHDLQEPLRLLSVYSDLIRRDLNLGNLEAVNRHAEIIKKNVNRMEAQVNDLLTYSRADHVEPVLTPSSSEAAFADAVALSRQVIDESGAVIEKGPLPDVLCEPSHLTMVFHNLLSNAIKYRKPGVPLKIEVSAKRQDSTWRFEVKDNGVGFEPRFSEYIFGLFKRLPGTWQQGTGLGLPICRRLIERSGGSIYAEGWPGEGSRFIFTLDAVDQAEPEEKPRRSDPAASAPVQPRTVKT
jgi:PAS domain S-box-containing protein